MSAELLDADCAITLNSDEAKTLDGDHYWTGWKRRHWPADLLHPGLRLYGFDTKLRQYTTLLEVAKGGTFNYRTRREFFTSVHQLTGLQPDQHHPHSSVIPTASSGRPCTGIAYRIRLLRDDIHTSWHGRFPRLGWQILRSSYVHDPINFQSLAEGDPRLRRHIQRERNGDLARKAKQYWKERLNALRCLVCDFSFRKQYGPDAADVIELHHDMPIAAGHRLTRIQDLKPVCPNCHRMLHFLGASVLQPLTIAQLRRRLRLQRHRHSPD